MQTKNRKINAVVHRGVFTTQSNIYDGATVVNYFLEKAPW